MKAPLLLLALAASALPAHASGGPEPAAPGTQPPSFASGPQTEYTVEQAPFELEAGKNELCRRMRATGNPFQPWNCESDDAAATATWLVSPDGEKRLAVVTRVPGERWALEHLIKMGPDGRALSFASYVHHYDPDKCFVSDHASRTYLELSLHGCSVTKIDSLGGTLYHRSGGPLSGGRFRADFNWLTVPQPSWGRHASSVDIDASAIRTFRLQHPAQPGTLREANLRIPDRDRLGDAIQSTQL